MAAVGDLHYGEEAPGPLTAHLDELRSCADILLIAGDLTRHGEPAEAEPLAAELASLGLPVVAVLGNHDYHRDREQEVAGVMKRAGVTVLRGSSTVVEVAGARLGIAGAKGFGGGFAGACVTEFGEPETKAFAHHAVEAAEQLACALSAIAGERLDVRVALLHYSPVEDTLVGEPPPVWPFLGNFLLAEAVDRARADLVVHGHAHAGSPRGCTPGGVRVLNVAQPVIRKPFELVQLAG